MLNIELRFWSKVDIRSEDECWPWLASGLRTRYGSFSVGPKNKRRQSTAHRFAWELINGDIPAGMYVCHRCDNPSCMNPNHLFLGTPSDNTRDMMAKGKGPQVMQMRKTHCKNGHEFSLENTQKCFRGCRKCRICANLATRESKRKARLRTRLNSDFRS